MASYDEFVRAAQNAGVYDQFSAYDLALAQANPDVGIALVGDKVGFRDAPDDATRSFYNNSANQKRSTAYDTTGGAITSYTGGSWGNEWNPIYNGNANNPTLNGNPTGSMVPQTSTNQGATASSFTPQLANASGSQYDASNLAGKYPTITISPASSYDKASSGPAPTFNDKYTPQLEAQAATLQNYPEFTYSPYTDRYDADIQAARQEAFNRDPFSYDYATDPVYQAYAKQYRREGERSMQNTLAQNAARTGGVASSAAVAAAQQANNYYNAQLSDKIPQLYADAYNRYLQDYSMSMDKLNSLMKLSDTDYNRYDTNRKFDFNIYQDRYGQARDYFDALNTLYGNSYNQYQTQLDQYNKDRNFDFDVWAQNEENRRYVEEMQNKAALDEYNALVDLYGLGYDQEQAAIDRAYNEAQDEKEWEYKYWLGNKQYSGSGSGRSSGGSGSGGSGSSGGSTGGGAVTGTGTGTGTGGTGTGTGTTGTGAYSATTKDDTIPVYMSSTGNELYDAFTETDLAKLIEEGVVRGMYMPNGTFRYIYVGDVTGRKTQEATPTTKKKSPVQTTTVERN